MTQKTINLGTADQGNGDPLRVAFSKVNDNFTELYTALGLINDANLNLGAFEFSGSVMSTTDSSAITIDQAVSVTSNLTVGGDILPQTANGGDLGSSTNPWRSLYVSNNTIYIGGISLSIDSSGNLRVNGNAIADVGTAAWGAITGKPTFATVATSGSYSDLSGRPSFGNITFNSQTITTSVTGGDVILQAANHGAGNGGDVTLAAGTGTANNGIVQINTAGAYTWTFDNGGNTSFPGRVSFSSADGDITGSVFADDSTLLVDAVGGVIPAGVLSGTINNDIETGLLRTSERHISLGYQSGGGQGTDAIAIGAEAAFGGQGAYSIAIGSDAGSLSGDYVIAIGKGAGDSTEDNCITIGRDTSALFPNSIVLNATSGALSAYTDGLFIKPITTGEFDTFLQWDPVSGQVGANSYLWFSDFTRQYTAYPGPQTSLTGDVKGSVFGDDSTILVDGTNSKIRGNVETTYTWTVDVEDKTWTFDYLGGLTFPDDNTITTSGNTFRIQAGSGNLLKLGDPINTWTFNHNDGMLSVPAVSGESLFVQGAEIGSTNSGIGITVTNSIVLTTDVLGTSNTWTFGTDGSLTVPGNSTIKGQDNTDLYELGGSLIFEGGLGGVQGQPGNILIGTNSGSHRTSGIQIGSDDERNTVQLNGNVVFLPNATVDFQNVPVSNLSDIGSEGDISIKINLTDSTQHIWRFGEDGDLNIPGNIVAGRDEDFVIETEGYVMSSPPGYITRSFTFGADGNLNVPGAITGGTNGADLQLTGSSTINLSSPSIYIGYGSGSTSGNIIIGGASSNRISMQSPRFQILSNAPTSSKGSDGDYLGMVAFNGSYIYYCAGAYDGVTDIWKRVSLTGGTW